MFNKQLPFPKCCIAFVSLRMTKSFLRFDRCTFHAAVDQPSIGDSTSPIEAWRFSLCQLKVMNQKLGNPKALRKPWGLDSRPVAIEKLEAVECFFSAAGNAFVTQGRCPIWTLDTLKRLSKDVDQWWYGYTGGHLAALQLFKKAKKFLQVMFPLLSDSHVSNGPQFRSDS